MKQIPCLLNFLGTVLLPLAAAAAPLTPDAALERAFRSGAERMAGHEAALSLAHTASSAADLNLYYVYNRPAEQGFIVVSADTRCLPVLAYADKGAFDAEALPENVKWWLDEYAREIEWAIAHAPDSDASGLPDGPRRNERAVIAPMVTTKWNQGAPFNNKCPVYGTRSVTGCVATAMAQVMNYHKWPQGPGTGSNTYIWNSQSIHCNFALTTFDWDNMLDVYDDNATSAQEDAVATLMYACGVAVSMHYSPSESGAYCLNYPYALKEYFRYDSNVSYLERDYYHSGEWTEMVYHELSKQRPVLYSGAGSGGGHAFVCDGYAGEGYFHFNWGWGGAYDGNFLLSALDPSGVGIGGGSGGYNYGQSICTGVGLPEQVELSEVLPIYCSGGVALGSSSAADEGYSVGLSVSGGGIANFSGYSYSGNLGLALVKDGVTLNWFSGPSVSWDPVNLNGGYNHYTGYETTLSTDGLAAGDYELRPAFMPEGGEWMPIRVILTGKQYIRMTVADDGTPSFSNAPSINGNTLLLTGFSTENPIESEVVNNYTFTFTNGSVPYDSHVTVLASSADMEAATVGTFNVSADAETSVSVTREMRLDLDEGVYDLSFEDDLGNQIGTVSGVSVTEATGDWEHIGTGSMAEGFMCNFFMNFGQQTLDIKVQKSKSVPGLYRIKNPMKNLSSPYSNLKYNNTTTRYMLLHCENAPYAWLEHFDSGVHFNNEEVSVHSQGADMVEANGIENVIQNCPEALGQKEDRTITYSPKFTFNGQTYTSFLGSVPAQSGYFGNGANGLTITLPAEPQTGIRSLGPDDEAPVEIFTLGGIRVGSDRYLLAPGIYILRQGTKTSKILIR